jgi:DNA-binding CsgD family transcriptional regulator
MPGSNPEAGVGALVPRADGGRLVLRGVELVELSERFYRGLFAGGVAFVGVASVVALALLPGRPRTPATTAAMLVATVPMILVAPVVIWRAERAYGVLRRSRRLELALVAVATAMVVYPLRSELYWPACGLITVVAIMAPTRRWAAYCFVALAANLAAHTIAGDLGRTPAEAIVGLWIGLPFWAATFSVVGDRFAAQVLLLQTADPVAVPPLRVRAHVGDVAGAAGPDPRSVALAPAAGGPPPPRPPPRPKDGAMGRLTARQLQVTALLVDGLRYREVAACLSISERQVQRHVAAAVTRAAVRTANELIAVAAAEGLAPLRAHVGAH